MSKLSEPINLNKISEEELNKQPPFVRVFKRTMEAKEKYPNPILADIHNWTLEEMVERSDEYEGANFLVTSYSLKEFAEKILKDKEK